MAFTFYATAQDVTNGTVSKYNFDQENIIDEISNNDGVDEGSASLFYTSGYGTASRSPYFDGSELRIATIDDSIIPFTRS